MADKQLKLCLIGFGHAARSFCRLLLEKADELREEYGTSILVTAIAGRSKGSLMNSEGIDLKELLEVYAKTGRLTDTEISSMEIITDCDADVMLELSTLSIMDGQPAISHIEKALERGQHVITANKGPIAWDYKRLSRIASELGCIFLYETTVMDGTPIFNLTRETLHGCKVLSFKGILNSTTNFILAEMELGGSFSDAVKEAQRRGFAEADPSMDIDGWDAAAKTAAIANVLLKADLKPTDIQRTGIGAITPDDIKKAGEAHKKIKLICEAYLENGRVIGKVHPVEVDVNALYSTIDATSSILSITTDLMGEISIIEKDPEIEQTAYGIYSDLLTVLKKIAVSRVASGVAYLC